MKIHGTNIRSDSPSNTTTTIESQARTRHSKTGKIAAKVAKLFQPCLPILGVGKKTRMVLEKTPAVPPQTKTSLANLFAQSPRHTPRTSFSPEKTITTLAELREPSLPSSPRGSSVNQMAEEIGEGLRREIASKLAEKCIVQVDEVKAHFTAARTSKWGHNHPEQIEQWVDDLLVTTNIDTPHPLNTLDHKVDTWIAQQLEAPIAAKKAELIASGSPGGQALLDNGFKKALLDTLLQTNADPELEDEDFEAYLMNKVETVLAQTEYPSLSLQLDTGEIVTLPGAYMKTKSADWHTSDLPKLMTELKNALAKETDKIKRNSTGQDWEDVLVSQNLPARLEAYFTQRNPQELAQHCPELIQTLIQQTLEAPENYTAHFITKEGVKIRVQGEDIKAQGKEWRKDTFPNEVKKLEEQIERQVQKQLTIRENTKDYRPWNEFIDQNQVHLRLSNQFTNPTKSAFGFLFPQIVERLINSKLYKTQNHFFYHESRYGTTTRIASRDNTKSQLVEDNVHETIIETQKLLFAQRTPWNRGKGKIHSNLANELKNSLKLDKQHTDLAQTLIDEALQHNPGYELFSTNRQFKGGYFKRKNLQTDEYLMANTLVMGVHGEVYELLNTLSQKDCDEIQKQHEQTRPLGQTVIGKGGFGKVRFARHLGTGEIVAVKKTMAGVRKLDAEAEIQQHQMILDRVNALPLPGHTKRELEAHFALMQDYTHRWPTLQARSHPNPRLGTTNKSYIFSPLANRGDGFDATEEIYKLRQSQNPAEQVEASKRYLHIAESYAKAITLFHQLGFHHRDIKPENFLHFNVELKNRLPNGQISTRTVEQIKLADFGLAKDDGEAKTWGGGTPDFSPPEEGHVGRYDAGKHDNFSLGMSLLTIKLGTNPYNYSADHLTLKTDSGFNRQVKLDFYTQKGDNVPKVRCFGVYQFQLKDLDMTHMDNIIAKLIARNPKDRISAAEALSYIQALDPNQDHLA